MLIIRQNDSALCHLSGCVGVGEGERVGAELGDGTTIAGENSHSPGFMSGSENWLGAGMGSLNCSEGVFAS